MSGYFNSDQISYMESLHKIPPEQKCYCGWYRLGECPHCPKDKTCADKMREDDQKRSMSHGRE